MAEIDKLEIKITTNATSAKNKIEKLIESLNKLKGIGALDNLIDTAAKLDVVMKSLASSVNGMNRAMTKAARGTSKAIEQGKESAERMRESTERATAEVEEQTSAAEKLGEVAQESAVNTESALSRIVPILKTVGTYTASVAKQAVKIAAFPFTAIGKGLSSIGSKIGGILHQIMRMLKMRIYRLIAKQIIDGFTTGINNAYQWALIMGNQFAGSMDMLATSVLYLKNSIGAMVAPLINAVAPAVDYVVDKFVDLLNIINQVFALLTGKSSWIKARKVPQEFAEAAKDATGAAKKLHEEVVTILGLDEINPLNDQKEPSGGSGSGNANAADYGSMFTEEAVAFSETFSNFFDPIKKAWDNKGAGLMTSIQNALDNIKGAADAVKDSFWTVWTNGTGQESVEHILGILTGIFDTFGNIAAAFKKGWTFNGNGTAIIQTLWGILNDILGMFEQISLTTSNWAKNLNLMPLIASFNNLLIPIKGIAEKVTGGIAWAWENIILPMAKWGTENGLPAVLDAVASALTVINDIITLLSPALKWIYDNIVTPVVDFAGDELVAFLKDVKGLLDKIHEILSAIKDIANGDWSTGVEKIKKALGIETGGESKTAGVIETALRTAFPGGGVVIDIIGLLVDFIDQTDKEEKTTPGFTGVLNWFSTLFQGNSKQRELTGFTGILNWFGTLFQGNSKKREIGSFTSLFNFWDTGYTGIHRTLQVSGFRNIFNSWGTNFLGNSSVREIAKFTSIFNNWKEAFKGTAAEKILNGFTAKIQDFITSILEKIIPGFTAGIDDYTTNIPLKQKILSGYTVQIDGAVDAYGRPINIPGLTMSAKGGVFSNGRWNSIPQYASGTLNAGSMFVAGEAGPELVGHVGSRTEVLNQSQLAATMAASMAQANAGQNQLLSALLGVAQQIAENQGSGVTVSTSELVGGLQRMNRRDGRVIVATGG